MTLKTPDVEEYEQVKSRHDGDYEHSQKVVEDVGAERRQAVFRLVQFIWLVFGMLEALIGLRVLLKLLAANPNNTFAQAIYNFSQLFLWPFEGLTVSPSVDGMVLEIPSLIAMFVYAIVAWGLARFVWILFARWRARQVVVYEHRRE